MEELISICGRCFSFTKYEDLHNAPCSEKPELSKGTAQGMYHCPDCGIMVIACVQHPKVCKSCLDIMKGEE